ncbi:MAG: DNA repair protein RecO [Planctomycetota bacterium]
MAEGATARAGRRTTCRAIVGRRTDFHETSRIVVLYTREHGRIPALAKGAHRLNSPFLGALDLFNECTVTLSPDRGGLRLLERASSPRERRVLREPVRYLAASHWSDLCDAAWTGPDARLFDLLSGGLLLLERCPREAIRLVVVGLETRYLRMLGAMPDVGTCARCGSPLSGGGFLGADGALACRRHAGSPRTAVRGEALALLSDLERLPAREWPSLGGKAASSCASLLGRWLALSLERRPRIRPAIHAV